MAKLIFVEGIPGVGKSTTSAKLCERLNNLGYTASCYLEADIDNPIDLYWYAYVTNDEFRKILALNITFAEEIISHSICEQDYTLVRYQDFEHRFYSPELYDYFKEREVCYKAKNPVPYDLFTRIFLNRWNSFLCSDIRHQDFAIFDGAFMAHQINDLIRCYSASDEEIISHILSIYHTLSPHTPVVYYMESQDIWARIRAACIDRMEPVPPKEQTEFWNNRKRIDLLVLNKLRIESHRYDISNGNWDSAIESMLRNLLL